MKMKDGTLSRMHQIYPQKEFAKEHAKVLEEEGDIQSAWVEDLMVDHFKVHPRTGEKGLFARTGEKGPPIA